MGCKGCGDQTEHTDRQLQLFELQLDGLRARIASDAEAPEGHESRLQLAPVTTTIDYLERIEELRVGVYELRKKLVKAEQKLERFTNGGEERKPGNDGDRISRGRK